MPVDFPFNDNYDWDIELKAKDSAVRACATNLRNAKSMYALH